MLRRKFKDIDVVVYGDSMARAELKEDISLFRRALAVIGIHGAGLSNMLWTQPGTTIVEVCYSIGAPCPDFYLWVALGLGLDYAFSQGKGRWGLR